MGVVGIEGEREGDDDLKGVEVGVDGVDVVEVVEVMGGRGEGRG